MTLPRCVEQPAMGDSGLLIWPEAVGVVGVNMAGKLRALIFRPYGVCKFLPKPTKVIALCYISWLSLVMPWHTLCLQGWTKSMFPRMFQGMFWSCVRTASMIPVSPTRRPS